MWPAQRGLGRTLWLQAAQEKDAKKATSIKESALSSYRESLATMETLPQGRLWNILPKHFASINRRALDRFWTCSAKPMPQSPKECHPIYLSGNKRTSIVSRTLPIY